MPKRTDDNQTEIVKGLRAAGMSMLSIAAVGKGAPDAIAGGLVPCPNCLARIPQNVLLEIKNESQVPSKRRLTDAETKFHQMWRGPIRIVQSMDEALAILSMGNGGKR